MRIMKYRTSIKLKSGRSCELINIRDSLLPNYYLIAFPKCKGEPSSTEVTEMAEIGINKAKAIAYQLLGDEEAYTLVYSGHSARREKGWHVHIILLGNRWKKAWLYFVLTSKNVLQALKLRKDDSPKPL